MSGKKTTPTASELGILNVLWARGPLTVKSVHEALLATKDVGYTTTLKIMQNMHDKGFVSRKPQGRSHIYEAAYEQEETRGRLLDRFVDSTFSGSASSLVMQLLGNKKTSKKELDEIKRIIDEMDSK
ncbi:MAG: BlaI/MecI/CopY family transcriptional regulator [Prolixibacteraceae bacterium]|jgi:BlaI family penicillinase repressor|nr:BlaI/MecI/CopY family transcriptional regulator [Prolixibacteraceae bacterium]